MVSTPDKIAALIDDSPLTLDTEYRRDLAKGLPIEMPRNYYVDQLSQYADRSERHLIKAPPFLLVIFSRGIFRLKGLRCEFARETRKLLLTVVIVKVSNQVRS